MKKYLTGTNITLGLLLIGLIAFLTAISDILLPFVLAFVLAYILHPSVEKLARRTGHTTATALIVCGFCLCVIAVFLLLIPILQAQILDFMRRIPQLSASVWNNIKSLLAYGQENLSQAQLAELSEAVSGSVMRILTAVGTGLSRLFSNSLAVLNLLALILITPVVLFYILQDWSKIQTQLGELMPRNKEKQIKSVWAEIDEKLSGFIRGQLLVCLFLGIFYGIGLSAVGLDFGIIIGLLTGILSFIPYFGFGTGLIVSVLLGLMQGFSWGQWGGIAGIFIVGQILESYILTPYLVGNRVGLSPVGVIFALLVGGTLAGFLGILVAVPVSAILCVLMRHLLGWYQQTPFYKGKK